MTHSEPRRGAQTSREATGSNPDALSEGGMGVSHGRCTHQIMRCHRERQAQLVVICGDADKRTVFSNKYKGRGDEFPSRVCVWCLKGKARLNRGMKTPQSHGIIDFT